MKENSAEFERLSQEEVQEPYFTLGVEFDESALINREVNKLLYSDDFTESDWTIINSAAVVGSTITDDSIAESEGISQDCAGTFDVSLGHNFSIKIAKDAVARTTRFAAIHMNFSGAALESNRLYIDTSTGEHDYEQASSQFSAGVIDFDETYWLAEIAARSTNQLNTTVSVEVYPAAGSGSNFDLDDTITGSIDVSEAQVSETLRGQVYVGTTTAIATANVSSPDTAWFTSHADTLVPLDTDFANVVTGCIAENGISSQSQKINPAKAQHSIGSVRVKLLDINGSVTAQFGDRITAGAGLKGKVVTMYHGFKELTNFDDYSVRFTYIIDDVTFQDGVYELVCSDIQRSEKVDIYEIHTGSLTSSIDEDDMLIPITVANPADKFPLLEHDSNYSSQPGQSVGYIKIDDETICHSGWNAELTGLNVVERGAFNTVPAAHEVSETETDKKKQIDEVVYLEMATPRLVYATLTGVIDGQTGNMPDHWHLNIPERFVKLSDFQNIGNDLWDTSTNKGRMARFIETQQIQGKKFIESQLLQWMGAFMPVYGTGELGLRRLNNVQPFSPYSAIISTSQVSKYGKLKYDQRAVINDMIVKWNWVENLDRFTRSTRLYDTESIAKHGLADTATYEFQGVFSGTHTDSDIQNYFNQIRDRYASPPLKIDLDLLPQWGVLEVGDVVRVALPQVIDYYAASTLDRTMEVQRVTTNWITGRVTVSLFGGVESATNNAISASFVMDDDFYGSRAATDGGTDLASVLSIVDNSVTANATLTGAADHNDAIFYYEGPLTIPDGITVDWTDNAQFRIRDSFTVNGDFGSPGMGIPGGAGGENVRIQNSDNIEYTWPEVGSGALGSTFVCMTTHRYDYRSRNSIINGLYSPPRVRVWSEVDQEYQWVPNVNEFFAQGSFSQMPEPIITNPDGLSLIGVLSDLRGVSGCGGQASVHYEDGIGNSRVRVSPIAPGAQGANGGAAAVIITRNMTIGASGQVVTSGGDGVASTSGVAGGETLYGGSGSPGCGGGVQILIDGDASIPDRSKFIAKTGDYVAPPADYLTTRDQNFIDRSLGTSWGAGFYGSYRYGGDEDTQKDGFLRINYIPPALNGFVWFPTEEEQEVTGYNNKPVSWGSVVDDGSKPEDNTNFITATSELSDDAALGQTALWPSVTGIGKPDDNANQTTNTNQLTDGAALGNTALGSGISGTITGNTLRTSSSGQRIEISSSGDELLFYDANDDEVARIGIETAGGDVTILDLGASTVAEGGIYKCINAETINGPIVADFRNFGGGLAIRSRSVGIAGFFETEGTDGTDVAVQVHAANNGGVPLQILPNSNSTDPSNPGAGSIYIPSTQNYMRIYLDGAWRDVGIFRDFDNSGGARYVQFSNSLQMCWGTGTINSDSAFTVTFANAFTGPPYVFCSRLQANANTPMEPATISTGSFTIDRDDDINGDMTYYYFAIGYRTV